VPLMLSINFGIGLFAAKIKYGLLH
jgi:hypothetical protein